MMKLASTCPKSDMGVVWRLLCLHPNTIKPRLICDVQFYLIHDVQFYTWCWVFAITWRLSSVICKLFTFQASFPKPLGQLEPNLAGMFLGWFSTKFLFFVPVGYSTWLPGPIICSDWLKFHRSSSLKLMNRLNPNCKGMIIGMSFTKFLFFMPIRNPRWPPPQDID